MKKIILTHILIYCLAILAMADTGVALKVGKIFTPTNVIENGTILIKGTKIEKILTGSSVPAGYKIIDYSKYRAYPGIINSMTSLGLSGISMVREWNDTRETGKYNPHLSAFTAFYPWSNLIPNTRDFGTLTALAAPSGGIVSGKAVLVNLHGWTPEDMFIKKEAALIINLPIFPRRNKPSNNFSKTLRSIFKNREKVLPKNIAKSVRP